MNKEALRNEVKEKYLEMDEEYLREADEKISNLLLTSRWFLNAQDIFIYLSTSKEPNTIKIINEAFKLKKSIYVPKCIDKHNMIAIKIDDFANLVRNNYGIYEPIDGERKDDFDLIVVPCVSCSKKGERLGHGAGYYDNFLKDKVTTKIALCYEKLMCEDIDVDENDVRMDFVISEEGIF